MSEQLVKLNTPELEGIEKSKATQIKSTFEPMANMLTEFEDAFKEVVSQSEKGITKDVTAKAKRLRIDIGKVRIETEKLRKEQKEEYLRAGKAIDGVSNILKWAISDKENKLKEIESYFETQEQNRLEALQTERELQLSKYVDDAHERNLSEMETDVWEAYISAKKKEQTDRIEAEKKVEAERVAKEKAEADERERMAKENERLKQEAEQREKAAAIEAGKRAKQEAEKQAEYERGLKKEREEKERIEKQERERREKLEAQIQAQKDAEEKRKQEDESRNQAELNKGDTAKVKDLLNDLNGLKTKYSFKSAKNKKMYLDVSTLLDRVIEHATK